MVKTIREIAEHIQGTVIGDDSLTIQGVTNIENPEANFITFINDEKLLEDLEATNITCIIAPKSLQNSKKTLITCDNPKLGFAQTLQLFNPPIIGNGQISKTASIAKDITLGKNVTIEDFVVIKSGTKIGDNVFLKAGCYVGENVIIGNQTQLHPNVVIYSQTQIGNHVIIHANSTIGSDGFGYVHTGIEQVKVPQVGNVIIEDQVEIGACTTIDRATIGSTIIRRGVKIDNQVQIAHNCDIGENTALSSFVGISGSSKLGKNCIVGGQVGFGDHCEIGNNVMIGAQAGIPTGKKVKDNQVLLGSPARPIDQTKKQVATLMKLPQMAKKISSLEEKVKELES